VENLRAIHGDFIGSVRDDVSTGSTPRKRTWNVPAGWQTTQPREALLQRYRSTLPNGHTNDDAEVVYQTIGEASVPTVINVNSGESSTSVDSVPTTPVGEVVMLEPASITLPQSPVESSAHLEPDNQEQENIPPQLSAFVSKEPVAMDLYKSTGPTLTKPATRTGHKRTNSALTESVTASNLPMRKTRRPA
jgi:hypothetical protein